MKQIALFTFAMVIAAGAAVAQGKKHIGENEVPKPALNSWHAKYPGAIAQTWEMEGNDYEVIFTWKGVKYEAIFNSEGTWVESETWLKQSQLPPAVQQALTKSHLETWKITSIEMVSTPHDEEFYEIDLKRGEEVSEIFYDHDGTLLADDRWEDEDEDEMLSEEEVDDDMSGN